MLDLAGSFRSKSDQSWGSGPRDARVELIRMPPSLRLAEAPTTAPIPNGKILPMMARRAFFIKRLRASRISRRFAAPSCGTPSRGSREFTEVLVCFRSDSSPRREAIIAVPSEPLMAARISVRRRCGSVMSILRRVAEASVYQADASRNSRDSPVTAAKPVIMPTPGRTALPPAAPPVPVTRLR